MSFFKKMFTATVKTALTPLAVIKDGANVLQGKDANSTSNLVDSISKDVDDAFDDIT